MLWALEHVECRTPGQPAVFVPGEGGSALQQARVLKWLVLLLGRRGVLLTCQAAALHAACFQTLCMYMQGRLLQGVQV